MMRCTPVAIQALALLCMAPFLLAQSPAVTSMPQSGASPAVDFLDLVETCRIHENEPDFCKELIRVDKVANPIADTVSQVGESAGAQFKKSQQLWLGFTTAFCQTSNDAFGPRSGMFHDCVMVSEDARLAFLHWAYAPLAPPDPSFKLTDPAMTGKNCNKEWDQTICDQREPGDGVKQAEYVIAEELNPRKKVQVYTANPMPADPQLLGEFQESIKRWRVYRDAACASVSALGSRFPSQQECLDTLSRQMVEIMGWLP